MCTCVRAVFACNLVVRQVVWQYSNTAASSSQLNIIRVKKDENELQKNLYQRATPAAAAIETLIYSEHQRKLEYMFVHCNSRLTAGSNHHLKATSFRQAIITAYV